MERLALLLSQFRAVPRICRLYGAGRALGYLEEKVLAFLGVGGYRGTPFFAPAGAEDCGDNTCPVCNQFPKPQ